MPEELIRRKRRLSSFQIITLGFAGGHSTRSATADAADLHDWRECNSIQ